jgi:purine-cytosine permease-like protein
MVVCEYEYPDVRVPSPLDCVRMSNTKIWLSHSFASGTLGPVTFGLGLRDSCLVILFFNLLCAVPPAYL